MIQVATLKSVTAYCLTQDCLHRQKKKKILTSICFIIFFLKYFNLNMEANIKRVMGQQMLLEQLDIYRQKKKSN